MIDFQSGTFVKLGPIAPQSLEGELKALLVQGEQVHLAFKGIRDSVVFTDKRLISINVQGITGKKRDYTSLPLSKIQAWSVETAGPSISTRSLTSGSAVWGRCGWSSRATWTFSTSASSSGTTCSEFRSAGRAHCGGRAPERHTSGGETERTPFALVFSSWRGGPRRTACEIERSSTCVEACALRFERYRLAVHRCLPGPGGSNSNAWA